MTATLIELAARRPPPTWAHGVIVYDCGVIELIDEQLEVLFTFSPSHGVWVGEANGAITLTDHEAHALYVFASPFATMRKVALQWKQAARANPLQRAYRRPIADPNTPVDPPFLPPREEWRRIAFKQPAYAKRAMTKMRVRQDGKGGDAA